MKKDGLRNNDAKMKTHWRKRLFRHFEIKIVKKRIQFSKKEADDVRAKDVGAFRRDTEDMA